MAHSKKSPITKTRRRRSTRGRSSAPARGAAPPSGQPVVRPNGVVEVATWRASPRRTLRAGDTIEVSKGPYWQGRAEDGTPVRHRMAESGTMTFQCFCECGDSAWVEARTEQGGRVVVLPVGPPDKTSPLSPGIVRRPYRIAKPRKKNKGNGRRAQ